MEQSSNTYKKHDVGLLVMQTAALFLSLTFGWQKLHALVVVLHAEKPATPTMGLATFISRMDSPFLNAAVEAQGKMACLAERPENSAFTKKLQFGYEISLGPTRDHSPDTLSCTAAIYDRKGKVVFRTTGFSVILDDEFTGKDFDGDGQGEVVFQTDTGNGMHCCWSYNVISMFPRAKHLFDLDPGFRLEKEVQSGRTLIWQPYIGPYGLTTEARVPAADRAFLVVDGKLVDRTPQHCAQILSRSDTKFREQQEVVSRQRRSPAGERVLDDDGASALLSLAMQYMVCGQIDKAIQTLNLWPTTSGGVNRIDVLNAFATRTKQDYPDFSARFLAFAKRLKLQHP